MTLVAKAVYTRVEKVMDTAALAEADFGAIPVTRHAKIVQVVIKKTVCVLYAIKDCGDHPVEINVTGRVPILNAILRPVNVLVVTLTNGESIVKMIAAQHVPGAVTKKLDTA